MLMESLQVGARIGVQVGEPLDGNQKSWLNLELNYGNSGATAVEEQMKELLKGEDPELSLILVLHARPDSKKELAQAAENILKNKYKSKTFAPALGAILMGVVGYKVISLDDDRVVVQFKPGMMSQKKVAEGVEQMTPALKPAESEEGTLKFSVFTGADFYEMVQNYDAGFKALDTIMKAFKGELSLSSKHGFNVLKKFFEMIEAQNPYAPQMSSLIGLLEFGEIDLTFKGFEEMPEELRKTMGDHEHWGKFPRYPVNKDDTATYDALNAIVDFLAPNFEVYTALKGVAGLKIDGNLPGFGTGMKLKD